MTIHAASSQEHNIARQLFTEYAKDIGVDLSFQDFASELQQIEKHYAPPGGGLLLLKEGDAYTGCAAVRKFSDGVAELKRMYIKKEFRGGGFGKELLNESIRLARSLGYRFLRLDTLPFMDKAIALYRSFGFREIDPYRYNPIAGSKFFELDLMDDEGSSKKIKDAL